MYTEWQHTSELFKARDIIAQLKDVNDIKANLSFILSLGIQMGVLVINNVVNPVKYAGCAKTIAVD